MSKPIWTGPHCVIIEAALAAYPSRAAAAEACGGISRASFDNVISGKTPLTHGMLQKFGRGLKFTELERSRMEQIAVIHAKAASTGGDSELEIPDDLSGSEKRRIKAAQRHLFREVEKEIKRGRFVVTTAMQGAPVHMQALATIEVYMAHNAAKLVVLPSQAHHRPLSEVEYPLDDALLDTHWSSVYKSIQFNKHLTAIDMDARPYQPDPLTGLDTLGAGTHHSYLIAHPTQRLRSYPASTAPRIQWCTGAITVPKYNPTKAGKLAATRHVMGALIVEITQDRFHVRPVQFADDGSFIDIAGGVPTKYTKDKAVPLKVTAKSPYLAALLKRGDDHAGYGQPDVLDAVDALTKIVVPAKVTAEDIFDSSAASHHAERSLSQQINIPDSNSTLAKEGKTVSALIGRITGTLAPGAELVILPSNHHEHLKRYLDEGRFVKDKVNYKTALQLAASYHLEGKDPVQVLCDPDSKARWLKEGESLRIEGIEYGDHGHHGIGGAPGSTRGLAKAHGKSGAGHTHTPEILWGVYRTGTMTQRDMGYNKGPNPWGHAVEVCWPGGQRQLIFVIKGKCWM